jgi:isoquinoline 1-oxidoreductase beta subunit
MLIEAAARQWRVDSAACHAQKGEVVHAPTGRRAPYGALVDIAATLPMPTDLPLKSPNEFELIGKPVKRLDSPIKVWGEARFGIDATVPGMLIATVAACPVPGGKLKDVDDSAAKKVGGQARLGGARHRLGRGRECEPLQRRDRPPAGRRLAAPGRRRAQER